jgi:hypothetical protein
MPGVEDTSLEMPRPTAIAGRTRPIGDPAPQLLGFIRDLHSRPLEGVSVSVTTSGGRQLVNTHSDHQGGYRATGLPDGFVNVIVGGPAYHPDIRQIAIRAGHPQRQDFSLPTRSEAVAARGAPG